MVALEGVGRDKDVGEACSSVTEGAGVLNAGVGVAPGWWSLEKRQFH